MLYGQRVLNSGQCSFLGGPKPASARPDVVDQHAAVEDELVHAPIVGAPRPSQCHLGQRVPGDDGSRHAGQHFQHDELGRGQGQVTSIQGLGQASAYIDAHEPDLDVLRH